MYLVLLILAAYDTFRQTAGRSHAHTCRYLDYLLKENERLRSSVRESTASTDPQPASPANPTVIENAANQETTQNPLIEERAWFHPLPSLESPIFVGEASDSAYCTRFRQTVGTVCTNHLPRISFIQDEPLMLLSETERPWPTPARARFLVKVALNTICRYYHIVRKSVVLESLEEAIKQERREKTLKIAKLLALFALGEAYSARSADPQSTFPGLLYFVHSRKMVSIPFERPQVDSVEISLLLVSFFCGCSGQIRGIMLRLMRVSDGRRSIKPRCGIRINVTY